MDPTDEIRRWPWPRMMTLRESVRNWYRKTFGVRIDLVAQGATSIW